jgi:hypothetical protein
MEEEDGTSSATELEKSAGESREDRLERPDEEILEGSRLVLVGGASKARRPHRGGVGGTRGEICMRVPDGESRVTGNNALCSVCHWRSPSSDGRGKREDGRGDEGGPLRSFPKQGL